MEKILFPQLSHYSIQNKTKQNPKLGKNRKVCLFKGKNKLTETISDEVILTRQKPLNNFLKYNEGPKGKHEEGEEGN